MPNELESLPKFVSDISETNLLFIKEAEKHFTTMTESMANISGLQTFDKIEDSFNNLTNYADQMNSTILSIEKALETFKEFSKDLQKVIKTFEKAATKFDNAKFQKDFRELKNDITQIKRHMKIKEPPTTLDKFASKEWKGVKGQIQPIMKDLMIPGLSGMGFMGGLLQLIIYGVQEQQKKGALVGQAKNLYVEAFDSVNKKLFENASKWLGDFAYTSERTLGIVAGDILAVAKAFMDAGASIKETTKNVFDKGLGEVGKNLITYTLAIDKMFEIASGTTAQQTVDYMKRYGVSAKEAAQAITDMLFYGRQLEIGSENFLEDIQSSADALETMGYRMSSVIKLSVALQEKFRSMGVPKFMSAKVVAQGLQNVAQGMANADVNTKGLLAQLAGYGNGVDAYMKFSDNLVKILASNNDEAFQKDIVNITKGILHAVDNDMGKFFMFVESSAGLGWGVKAAQFMKVLAQAIQSGDSLSAFKDPKVLKEFKEQISKSYGIEKQKSTQLQLQFNEWLIQASKLGQSLLGILGEVLAQLILGFRTILAKIDVWFGHYSKEDKEKINANIDAAQKRSDDRMETGIKDLKASLVGLGKAGMGMGVEALGKTFDVILDSMKTNFKEGTTGGPSLNVPPGETIKYLPSISMGQAISSPEAEDYPSGVTPHHRSSPNVSSDTSKEPKKDRSDYFEDSDTFEPLHLVKSQSIQTSNEITISLAGNCPGCGLNLGGSDSSQAEKSTSSSKSSPSSISILSTVGGTKFYPKVEHSIDLSASPEKIVEDLAYASGTSSEKRKEQPLDPGLANVLKEVATAYPGKAITVNRTLPKGKSLGSDYHSQGKAIDFSVEGVSKEDLFKTLYKQNKTGGLGYYPNDPFVHADVRDKAETWVDTSKSGQKADYIGHVAGSKEGSYDPKVVSEYLKSNLGITGKRGE